MARRSPGVSYAAESRIRELWVCVRSTDGGTVVSVIHTDRRRGDQPLQGQRWFLREENAREATSVQHLLNLAQWGIRQALAGRWHRVR